LREIHALPNRKLRPLPTANAALEAIFRPIAHWQIDETGTTTTVADLHGNSDLTWSDSATATAPLYKHDGSGFGGARISPSSTVSRTNFALRSQEINNSGVWTHYSSTIDTNGTVAPDTTSTADGIIPNAGFTRHAVYQGIALTAGTYSFSVYARAGVCDYLIMTASSGPAADAIFNLTTGAIEGTPANCTAAISSVGSGWYRCSITYSVSTGAHDHFLYSSQDAAVSLYSGDASSVGTWVWGVQVEDSAVTTPYIPTTTVPVTASTAVAQYALGASTSTQRTRLAGDVSVHWVGDFSDVSGTQCLLAHGVAGTDVSANNYLLRVQVINGAVRVYWEYGTGSDVTVTTPVAVTTGLHTIGVRRRDVRSVTLPDLIFTDVFVDGELIHSDSRAATQAPTGGGSGSWGLGADVDETAGALATIYDCQVLGYAMSDDWFRSGARRVLRTFSEEKLLSTTSPGNYSVYHRVLLEDPEVFGDHGLGLDQNMVDLDALGGSWTGHGRSFLEDVQWSDDVDAAGASAAFTLTREIFNWSTAPGMTDASPVASSSGINLLQVARRVKIETAVVPFDWRYEDLEPYDWSTKFDGFISAIDWTADPIQVQCRDRIAPLQWTICEPLASKAYYEAQYGDDATPVELETVLQQIIDDHADVGFETLRGGKPTLYCPISPAFGMRKRSIGFDPIQTVLKSKTDQIGWQCRYIWQDDVKDFLLTLSQPDRAVSIAQRTFDPDAYLNLKSVAIDEANIRNYCHVVYGDVSDRDSLAVPKRKRASAQNTASIEKYGRRYCQVAEDVTSDVDTLAEAEALAEAVVADLAEPKVAIEMVLSEWPQTELSDYYAIDPDDVHFSAQQKLAVIGYAHVSNSQGGITTVKLRGQPVAQYNRYMSVLSQPGAGGAPFRAPEIPSTVSVAAGPRSAEVSFDYPTAERSAQFDQAEIHLSTTPGFTASAATLAKVVRGNRTVLENLPLEKKYAQIVFRDKNNNRTDALETSFFPSISERDLPASFRRRQYWMYHNGAALGFSNVLSVGTGSPTVTGAGVPGTAIINNEAYYSHFTGNTSGNIASVRTASSHRGIETLPGIGLSFYCRWGTANASSSTVSRMGFIGMTERTTVDVASSRAAVPSQQGHSFGFFIEEDDVYALVSNGSAQTSELIYSIVAGSGTEAHELVAGYDPESGYFWFQVDDGDFVYLNTNTPDLDSDVYAVSGTRTTTAANKSHYFAHFAVNY